MRVLTDHQVNPANEDLTITVCDEPGSGGANHRYLIEFETREAREVAVSIDFQNGPIKEAGVNGLTHEALIAILCDRLEGFQSGPYANDDNGVALSALRLAQEALQKRTKARMARGVEGTHAV